MVIDERRRGEPFTHWAVQVGRQFPTYLCRRHRELCSWCEREGAAAAATAFTVGFLGIGRVKMIKDIFY